MPGTFYLLFLLLAVLGGIGAQRSVTIVEEDDPALDFSKTFTWQRFENPQWIGGDNFVNDYWHGGAAVAVSLAGASITLTFNGSYIAYYGDMNSDHGRIKVTVDGVDNIVNSFRQGGAAQQQLLFHQNVDADVPNHVITLTCLEAKQISFDYFAYMPAEPGSNFSDTANSSPSAINPSQSQQSEDTPAGGTPLADAKTTSGSMANQTSIIIASMFAALGWSLALVFLFLLLRLRRRRKDTTTLPYHEGSGDVLASFATSHTPSVYPSQYPSTTVTHSRSASNERPLTKQEMLIP
ncbi:hypothetical protein BKA62DRAFT_308502 [Auriculariales sp. MPI-PUGE-AT-0066]|nr:hypothetical protein BKA62DRAFT_308502 [Auriculariales sp. MPI-PUGE-AT-0066]